MGNVTATNSNRSRNSTSGLPTSPADRAPPINILGTPYRDVADFYIFHRILGQGAYGKVRRGVNKSTKQKVAIKSVMKRKIGKPDMLKQEIAVLKELNHPNIVKLLDVVEDGQFIHLITELCTGGELFDRIIKHPLTEAKAADVARQMLTAMQYFHDRGVVHRDIKPENMLFLAQPGEPGADTIKLCDFGMARFADATMTARVGTAYFMAPEMLAPKVEYDSKVDIWSAGCVLYTMLCGYPPFFAQSDREVFDKIRKAPLVFSSPDWDGISNMARDCITLMLTRDPTHRPTAKELLVSNPFLQTSSEGALSTSVIKPQSLEALVRFTKLNQFKRQIFAQVAQHLSLEELDELKNEFSLIDTNGDGVITLEELKTALEKYPPRGVAQRGVCEVVETIFKYADTDENFVLDWNEFLSAAAVRRDYMKKERIEAAFLFFDKDMNGTISKDEISTALGAGSDPELVNEIMKEADVDESGEVDLQEFMRMLEITLDGESVSEISTPSTGENFATTTKVKLGSFNHSEWGETPASHPFTIRGKTYLTDRIKYKCDTSAFAIVATDLYTLKTGATRHFAQRPESPLHELRKIYKTGEAQFFIMQFIFPGASLSLCIYAVSKPGIFNDPAMSGFAKTYKSFREDSDAVRCSRLKLIPRVVSGATMLKSLVGEVPVLLANKINTEFYVGTDYVECDVDLGTSSLAKTMVKRVGGAATTLSVDLGVLLEGHTIEQLPEVMLFGLRMVKPWMSKAVVFPGMGDGGAVASGAASSSRDGSKANSTPVGTPQSDGERPTVGMPRSRTGSKDDASSAGGGGGVASGSKPAKTTTGWGSSFLTSLGFTGGNKGS